MGSSIAFPTEENGKSGKATSKNRQHRENTQVSALQKT
jgi:hypothetical protein